MDAKTLCRWGAPFALPVTGIPLLILLDAGWMAYAALLLLDAGLFFGCNPYGAVKLPTHLRWMSAVAAWLWVPIFALPDGTLTVKGICAGISLFLCAWLRVEIPRSWGDTTRFAQSPEVDRVLSKMGRGEDKLDWSWEALAAWNGSGCAEVRSLIHQATGRQMTESELHGNVRLAWLHGRLSGEAYADGVADEIEGQLGQRDAVISRLRDSVEEYKAEYFSERERANGLEQELAQKVEIIKRNNESQPRLREENAKLQRQIAEARARVEELETRYEPPELKPDGDLTTEQKQEEMLKMNEGGMSLSKCAEAFGVSKSTAQRWINEAKSRREEVTEDVG